MPKLHTRSIAAKRLLLVLAVSVPALLLFGAALGQYRGPPSAGAQGMPGALGTFEFRPADRHQMHTTSFWIDTDGVDPGTPGCHIGVTQNGVPNGRAFGEACSGPSVLVETNPGRDQIHPHHNDIGHPDFFDCNAWCIGARRAQGGMCSVVAGPPPCAHSAFCQCR